MTTNSFQKYPPAFLFKLIERVRFSLIRFAKRLTISEVVLMETIQAFYVSKALGVVAELNIAEYLKDGDKDISELARLSKVNELSLYRIMRMLASQGIFKEKNNKVFTNSRLSKSIENKPNSMRHMVIHQINTANWEMFGELDYAVKTGNSAAYKVLKKDIFEHLEANPELNELYNKAMHNTSEMLSNAILSAYKYFNNKLIVDVGGGHGLLLTKIIACTKNTTGIVFDLPHVIAGAQKTIDDFKLSNRVSTIPGSFYESIPKGGHIYIMKNIIHALGENDCVDLLNKIEQAMESNGKILIIEPIIENHNRYSFAKLYDIQMMVGRSEGRERTKKEYLQMAEKANLKINKIVRTVSPFSIIEIIRI